MSQQEEFLKDLDIKEDSFDKPLEMEESNEVGETPEETQEKLKNRQARRLAAKLQAEREANIALSTRLQTLSEAKNTRESTEEADFLKVLDPLFGDDTPEKREATAIMKKAIHGAYKTAEENAFNRAKEYYENERGNESQAITQEENNLEEVMDELEEEYNVDFSNPDTRKGYLTLLERLSPKDKEGNIIEYADPYSTYELFESRREKSAAKNKELASRHMIHSGSSQGTKLQTDSTERFLRENGII